MLHSPRSVHLIAHVRRGAGLGLVAVGILWLAGCEGPLSTLEPAGRGAAQIAELFWWMTGGAALVWLSVVGLAVYAIRVSPEAHSVRKAKWLIIGGGAVFPTIVLSGYLVYGLALMPALLAPAGEGGLQIEVSGEQWWWRVRYITPEGETVELANEVRLPVGRRVDFLLSSPDVIHSFWIPSLGGKLDMIPGRVNRLTLEPTKVGTYRGACAEYCGTAHALMQFYAVVEEEDAFAAWLTRQAKPAAPPTSALAARGQRLFLSNGCGACHTVRGTEADGVVGPDLTHVGSRVSLGGGLLPTEPEDFLRWVAHTEAVKPGVHMPAFGMLPDEELRALAAYLSELE